MPLLELNAQHTEPALTASLAHNGLSDAGTKPHNDLVAATKEKQPLADPSEPNTSSEEKQEKTSAVTHDHAIEDQSNEARLAIAANSDLSSDLKKALPDFGRLLAQLTAGSARQLNSQLDPLSAAAARAEAGSGRRPHPTEVASESANELAVPTKPGSVEPPASSVEAEMPIRPPTEFVLHNPADSGGPIIFLANDKVHRLAPGEELQITADGLVLIEFHRGGNFGNTARELTAAGIYTFEVSSKGWRLRAP